jgi:hypothetical protein
MLAQTTTSYTKKNMNSKRSVQHVMLVGTNGTMMTVRGKDGRGRTMLLWIKTFKGLKREKFLPLWCGANLWFAIWSISSPIPGMPSYYFGILREREMERFDILRMVGSGNIFDFNHQEDLSNDPRNIRCGLSTDGMNPFREMRNPHSMWLVVMCIFNLPQWLCHKWMYLLLTTLIFGPKQAGIDIDVFLEPLMEEMQKLWEHGFNVWNEYNK